MLSDSKTYVFSPSKVYNYQEISGLKFAIKIDVDSGGSMLSMNRFGAQHHRLNQFDHLHKTSMPSKLSVHALREGVSFGLRGKIRNPLMHDLRRVWAPAQPKHGNTSMQQRIEYSKHPVKQRELLTPSGNRYAILKPLSLEDQRELEKRYGIQAGAHFVFGKGSVGEVCLGRNLSNGMMVAIKAQVPSSDNYEIDMMDKLPKNPCLIHYLDKAQSINEQGGPVTYIVLPILPMGDGEIVVDRALKLAQNDPDQLHAKAIGRMLKQLINCVDALHTHGIVHGDIKPHNMMFRGDATIQLIDFGYAKSMDATFNRKSGSFGYMAPEVMSAKVRTPYHGPAADIFALGTTIEEMYCGRLTMPQTRGTDALLPGNTLLEVTNNMRLKDAQKRPGIQEIRQYPYWDKASNFFDSDQAYSEAFSSLYFKPSKQVK